MNLTEREAEVLRLLASGQSQKAVARELGISRKTVEAHIHNAKLRNGVGRTSRLVFLMLTEEEQDSAAA